jgi:hypothetical protein
MYNVYTCASKPGRLMSHNWLHTPDFAELNEKHEMNVLPTRAKGTALPHHTTNTTINIKHYLENSLAIQFISSST